FMVSSRLGPLSFGRGGGGTSWARNAAPQVAINRNWTNRLVMMPSNYCLFGNADCTAAVSAARASWRCASIKAATLDSGAAANSDACVAPIEDGGAGGSPP